MEEKQSNIETESTSSTELIEKKCATEDNDIITPENIKAKKIKHESCPVCQCRFDPKLHDHAKNKRMYVCGICRKSFIVAKDLKKHFNAHLYDYPYTCDICNSGFQSVGTLNIHKRAMHGSITNVIGEKSGLKPFECTDCDKKFTSKSNLSSHQRVHSEKRPHHCTDCTRSFKTHSELKSHNLIHTNEKPFICPICHKGFRQSGNLSSHIRVHNEERPFTCNICGNAFRESSKLKRHYRLHTQEKPYACSECGRSFRDYSNMKKHLRTHFKDPLLLKSKSDTVVENKSSVVVNEGESQPDMDGEHDTYICNICGISFLEMGLAQIHVKSHQEEEEKQSESDNLELSNSS